MSEACTPSPSADRKAAIRDQLTRLVTARLQNSAPPCEIIPGDFLQGVALSLVRTRPIPAAERIAVLAEGAPILREVLTHAAGQQAVSLGAGLTPSGSIPASQLDAALHRLESADPALARMIEGRCYGGLIPEDQPALSDLPQAEVQRRWRIARAWLQDALTPAED